MISIVSVYHAGISSPLQACAFASIAKRSDAHVLYLEAQYLSKYVKEFHGIIDISKGVTIICIGDGDDYEEALLRYIEQNRNELMEQWTNARR
jgi:hypothetical protein